MGDPDSPVTEDSYCQVDLQPGETTTCDVRTYHPTSGKPYNVTAASGGGAERRSGVRSDAYYWEGDDFGAHVTG
ncbi:hypothetical protein ABT324_06835 [Saccharopolyspora sp. NPDC000359]|uniref:hypothetical protein n=1 Tax=Saccharopolyspora sp. NPDC000359 TaxID=3154251 RepID=UPI00332C08F4